MAKIHAFEFDDKGGCRVVLHTAMPGGSNSVGKTWKGVWLATGRAQTLLAEGTGIGNISTTEKTSVLAGDIIELSGRIPAEIIAQGLTAIDTFADHLISEVTTKLARELAYYGWTG